MSTEQQPDETPAADITQQVTSPTPTTRPAKNPKRVAAGKMVAERTKAAREAQKKAAAEAAVIIENKAKPPQEAPTAPSPATEGNTISSSSSSSFSTTQWLAVGSIVVSLVGIYYKREELKAFYNKKVAPQHTPQQPAPVEPEPATVAQPRKRGLKKMN